MFFSLRVRKVSHLLKTKKLLCQQLELSSELFFIFPVFESFPLNVKGLIVGSGLTQRCADLYMAVFSGDNVADQVAVISPSLLPGTPLHSPSTKIPDTFKAAAHVPLPFFLVDRTHQRS